jgi:hypothetical protein
MADICRDQNSKFVTDFYGESRHELVAKLAYEHWEARGCPLGSPTIDWFAAERALYEHLVAAGLVCPSALDDQQLERLIYR